MPRRAAGRPGWLRGRHPPQLSTVRQPLIVSGVVPARTIVHIKTQGGPICC
jgi:hypothetical protein